MRVAKIGIDAVRRRCQDASALSSDRLGENGEGQLRRALWALVALGATAAALTASPASALGPNAVLSDPGCYATAMFRNDDSFVNGVSIGFPVDFFGTTYTTLAVNNNGNVTFDGGMSTYTPFPILTTGRKIIAPFFGDVDTRNSASDVTRWGSTVYNGRPALCVTWAGIGVGYYSARVDKLNNFQLLLVDRSDIAPGDFDIIFNYDRIQWETGQASGGVNGLGGSSARAGWSNGTSAAYELAGSAVNGAFLDTNTTTGLIHNSLNSGGQLGRYVFFVRNGVVLPPAGDTTPPVLDLPDDITAEATSAAGAAVSYTAAATDDKDGDLTPTCAPASGSTFALGSTTVDCSATDAAGNEATGSFTVTVEDTTAPELTVPADLVAEATSAAGATVSYPAATASDAVDADPTIACSPASGGSFALGDTTVTCTATDDYANASSDTFLVSVVDTTAPAVSCANGVNPAGKSANESAGFRTAGAADAVGVVSLTFMSGTFAWTYSGSSANVKLTQAPGSSGSAAPGSGQVLAHLTGPLDFTVTATDAAGNAATVSCGDLAPFGK